MFQDPVGFGGGDLNLYGYVANNPVQMGDPAGLWQTKAHDMLILVLAILVDMAIYSMEMGSLNADGAIVYICRSLMCKVLINVIKGEKAFECSKCESAN
ncbi:MAG: hypothetical protein OEV92_02940 [Nitrospinota bacterium]|nr:hypothetical protein [Nitrospinota bacterium]